MDIRTERTRAMLVDAFERLTEKNAVEDVSVTQICELSTVRRATFYRHFEDKYDFYRYYLSTLTTKFLKSIQGEAHDCMGLREYVESMHRQLIGFVDDHPAIAQNSLGKTALAGSLDIMMRQIAEGIEVHAAREFPDVRVPAHFASMFYSGAMLHTLRWWLQEGRPIDADELVASTTDLFLAYYGC